MSERLNISKPFLLLGYLDFKFLIILKKRLKNRKSDKCLTAIYTVHTAISLRTLATYLYYNR